MRKNSCRSPSSDRVVAVKTTKTFWVRPKMAGIESRAKSTSVPPIAAMTSSIGVMTRLPSTTVKSRSPSYSSVVSKSRRAMRTVMLSPVWVSSPSGRSMLPAVISSTSPKR